MNNLEKVLEEMKLQCYSSKEISLLLKYNVHLNNFCEFLEGIN